MLTRSPQDAGGPRSALRRSPWEPGRQSPYDADAQEGLVRFPLKKENEMKTDVVGEGTRPTQRHVRGADLRVTERDTSVHGTDMSQCGTQQQRESVSLRWT